MNIYFSIRLDEKLKAEFYWKIKIFIEILGFANISLSTSYF